MSLMVLIAYNLASSSFWKTTVATIFNTFDKAIFDWSDTSSWFYKIIVLFGLVAVIKKLLGSMKRVLTYKTIISTKRKKCSQLCRYTCESVYFNEF